MNFNEKISKDSALDDMINLALFMSQSRLENPGMDCISCLAEQAEQTNLYIDVYNFNEDSVIVGIYENFTESKQTLIYLNKYLE